MIDKQTAQFQVVPAFQPFTVKQFHVVKVVVRECRRYRWRADGAMNWW
jgi:hypothetical protein